MAPQVKDFEKKLSRFLKIKYTVATNSGTSALHLALLGVGVSKDDEVLTPSLTLSLLLIQYYILRQNHFLTDDFLT